jgi:hypothetical protein
MAYLDGATNSHRDHDVRRAMVPLVQLADQYGCTVLVIRHLNKMQGGRAVHRGDGSIGIIGAARTGLLAGQHPTDDGLRVLAVAKSNLAFLPGPIAYRLSEDDDLGCARVEWLGQVDLQADDLVAPYDPRDRSAMEEAVAFLRVELADGPRPAREVEAAAAQASISESTLKRAKPIAPVVSRKVGDRWLWHLISQEDQEGQASQPPGLGPLDPLGPLPGLGADGPSQTGGSEARR